MEFVFSKPRLSDAEELMKFFNELICQKTFIAKQKKFGIKKSREFIRKSLSKMKMKNGIRLFAKEKGLNGIAASGEIFRNEYDCSSHIASIGMSVRKKYRNHGLGTMLLKRLISEGKKMKGIRIVHLNVFSINKDAIRFYKRHGFKIVARTPKWFNHYGRYCDAIDMYYKGGKL